MENLGTIAFGVFSLFMIKFAWDLVSYAQMRDKEAEQNQ